MGLEASRQDRLPFNIDDLEIQDIIMKTWTPENAVQSVHRNLTDQQTTMNPNSLKFASCILAEVFAGQTVKVLEIMSGSCSASKILYQDMAKSVTIESWRCTDILNNVDTESFPIGMSFESCHAVEAVARFGSDVNVLLMISPPPGSYPNHSDNKMDVYGDYYACRDFLRQAQFSSQAKTLVFIGELGASDGSQGMYKYLLSHPNLSLIGRATLSTGRDILGGSIEKELFVFHIRGDTMVDEVPFLPKKEKCETSSVREKFSQNSFFMQEGYVFFSSSNVVLKITGALQLFSGDSLGELLLLLQKKLFHKEE